MLHQLHTDIEQGKEKKIFKKILILIQDRHFLQ